MTSAIYLFCLSDRDCTTSSGTAADARDNTQFVYQHRGIYALSKRVTLEEFCSGEAERRLEDPAWVTPRAIEHGRVIDRAFRTAPVLPMRFATLFSSERALEDFIASNVIAISCFLHHARRREEWGIKALLDRRQLKGVLAASIAREDAGAISPGLRYIRERRADQAAEKQLNGWLEQACESAAAAVSGCAVQIRRREILDDAPQADGREIILNLAAFLARDRVTDLRRRIDELNVQLNGHGLTFTTTGPWPPYSFCPALEAAR